jgi:DNA polymerase III epsilon subunit
MTKYVFLDTETTGLSPHTGGHRIIEVACIEYEDKVPTGNVFNLKLNPEGKKSTKGAFRVHKIDSEELAGMPTFKDIHEKFISIIKDAHLVIFNAPFDIKFLNAELNRINYPSTVNDICAEVICAMDLAGKKFGLGRISQDSACRRYGIDVSKRTVHGAHIDASLCAQLFFKLIDKDEVPLKATPQKEKHAPTKAIPIPRAYRSKRSERYVQINFCKNSTCTNYGVPAKNPTYKPDGSLKRGLGNNYQLTWNNIKNENLLTCKLCGQSSIMIHNRCFDVEVDRLSIVGTQQEPACPNTANSKQPYGVRRYYIPYSAEVRKGEARIKPRCKNTNKGIFTFPELYKLSGKTQPTEIIEKVVKSKLSKGGKPVKQIIETERLGSQRIECKTCHTRFSVKLSPEKRQYLDNINVPLYLDLMNKAVLTRAEEKNGIDAKVIYDKINFFYQQTLAFDKFHSEKLDFAVATKSLNLSTDRQHYLSNWGDHNMPMPTPIMNTSTADNGSGYIFVSTVNFDFTCDAEEIKKEHREKKESDKYSYFRRFAQYVLSDAEVNESVKSKNIDIAMQMPTKGLLVHQTYSILTHFVLLKDILKYSANINLYADNDSGFKLAISAVFCDWIAQHKLNAFQVSPERSGGNQLLDNATAQRLKQKDAELSLEFPDISEKERKKLLWKEHISTRVTKPGSRSEWIVSPNSSRFAGFHPLSDVDNMDYDRVQHSLEQASLHGVDNWFQILRRHLNMLERPVTSATNSRRWNAYAGYNPEWMSKLIEIKRVYFNYCMTDERSNKKKFKGREKPTRTTPAMRLGLANKVYTAEEILGFNYNSHLLDSVYRSRN